MSARDVTVNTDQIGNKVTEYLTDNPRMIGVLFTVLLLMSQASNAAAQASSTAGP